ncbi:MAG: ABC transporter ATP-binding protein [Proteobacteria bacterium]|nr:ABC transporter ATP-binding protein [Pseudomonadota bacterium]
MMGHGGGHWHGGGMKGRAGAGDLPFAGIPPEMLDRTNALMADEPDFGDIQIEFSHRVVDGEPFSLWTFLAPYKFRMLGSLALVALTEVLLLIGPYLIKVAIDDAIIPGDFDVLAMVGVIWVGSLLVAVVVSGFRIRYVGRLGQMLMYELRLRVFAHLQRLSLDFFTGEKAGRLMTRMTSDIEALSNLLQTGLINLVAQILSLIFIIGILLSFNVQLTMILLVIAAPVMLVLTHWFRSVSEKGYETVRNRIAEVLSDLQESLSGMRLVISFNRMKHNVINHRNIVGDYREANNYTAWISAFYNQSTQFVDVATTLIILIVGYFILIDVNPTLDPDGSFTVGALIAFTTLSARFFKPITALTGLYNEFQSGNAAVIKLRGLLETAPSVMEKSDAHDIEDMQGDIEIRNLSFAYDVGEPVLDNVSLHIPAGQSISFVGPTGAGKSTLAKLIARFYDPSLGEVLIDGHNLRDVTLHSLHNQLGVVPQEPFLFHGSIKDNLRFSRPEASDEEIMEACRTVGIDDMIDRLPEGLDTPCHERGSSLSSGERQLLALARAFLSRPRVLILDEATSNVDQQSESKIEHALDTLLEGRTAIIIAHRLATAMRADIIAVINNRGIMEIGSHDELVKQGSYYADMYETWRTQNEGSATV